MPSAMTLLRNSGPTMVGALLARMFGTKRLAGSRFLGPTSTTTRGGKLTTLGIDLAVRAAHVATPTDERGEVLWKRRRFFNRTGMENGGHHPREAANVGSRGIRGLTPLRQSLHASSDPTGKHWRPSGVPRGRGDTHSLRLASPGLAVANGVSWRSGGVGCVRPAGQMSHSGHVLQSAEDLPEYTLDGASFDNLAGFFEAVTAALGTGRWGRNLDAFNDILRGGFGNPHTGFVLRWVDSGTSTQRLVGTRRFVGYNTSWPRATPTTLPACELILRPPAGTKDRRFLTSSSGSSLNMAQAGGEAEDNVHLILA